MGVRERRGEEAESGGVGDVTGSPVKIVKGLAGRGGKGGGGVLAGGVRERMSAGAASVGVQRGFVGGGLNELRQLLQSAEEEEGAGCWEWMMGDDDEV